MSQIASAVLDRGFSRQDWADSTPQPMGNAFRQLRDECQFQQAFFDAQPLDTRRLLEGQARKIAEALVQGQRQLSFALPEQVSVETPGRSSDVLIAVPAEFRQQVVAGLLRRLPVRDIRAAVRQRLNQLEQSHHQAVAASARLIRYAMVKYVVHDLLPAGDFGSVYMPQWVAFDDERLLVDSIDEAETRVALMQNYVSTLHLAVSLAPYIYADEEYQRKRYSMLGQLVNQGQSLACYWTSDIICKIERRAKANELNRGLSLSLPYFDDQLLEMRALDFEVIPTGRTLFIPAFVVLAARREQARVAQDMHLSQSTRMHLLSELKVLERAFESSELEKRL
jgi:hypothetical protein